MKLKGSNFQTKVPGKWILAGEHSVLRGSPALVFPLLSRTLELAYSADVGPLKLKLDGEHGEEFELLFWGVLEKACSMTKISRSEISGQLVIKSTIPVGAGLGASAALCVAIAQWFHWMSLISEVEQYEFARNLENLFHGESSGVDIAVALKGQGIRFLRNGDRTAIDLNWKPSWYVSYSGKRGVTIECVQKVKNLLQANLSLGQEIDEQMKLSVRMAEEALSESDEKIGFSKLQESMQVAKSCFDKWGLTPDEHVAWLHEQGAAAVKPTGSGGGGYVLSLWNKPPSAETLKRLIPCL